VTKHGTYNFFQASLQEQSTTQQINAPLSVIQSRPGNSDFARLVREYIRWLQRR